MNKKVNKSLEEFNKDHAESTYGSLEEYDKAREGNQDINAKMIINEEKGVESWVCECGKVIVVDINGDRAKITALNGAEIFVKFSEMFAVCKCERQNRLMFTADLDNKDYPNDTFYQDKKRAQKEKNYKEVLKDFLLKLK